MCGLKSVCNLYNILYFFFSSRRRHTRFDCDWSSDVCSSDLLGHRIRRSRANPDCADRIRVGERECAVTAGQIGRASLGKECRSRWSTYHLKIKMCVILMELVIRRWEYTMCHY